MNPNWIGPKATMRTQAMAEMELSQMAWVEPIILDCLKPSNESDPYQNHSILLQFFASIGSNSTNKWNPEAQNREEEDEEGDGERKKKKKKKKRNVSISKVAKNYKFAIVHNKCVIYGKHFVYM